jgi:hypothetical protein
MHHRQNPLESTRLWLFENRVLRRIFKPEKGEVTGGWKKFLQNLYSSPNIIRVMKSKKMGWAGHEMRHTDFYLGNLKGKILI